MEKKIHIQRRLSNIYVELFQTQELNYDYLRFTLAIDKIALLNLDGNDADDHERQLFIG